MPERILIVEDDTGQRELLSRILHYDGYEVVEVDTGMRAVKLAEKEPFDLVLSDLKLPGMDGIEVIERISKSNPQISGIIVTGYGNVDSAIKAIRLGICDYIKKPFEVDELRHAVKRALELRALKTENLLMKNQLRRKYSFDNIVGKHPKMMAVFKLIEKVAATDST
ncbi:MAG: response regulator, partial [Candidatus Bathyarchaeia archaeon]